METPPFPVELTDGLGPEEQACLSGMAGSPGVLCGKREAVREIATDLATAAREDSLRHPGLDALLAEYSLDSREGIVLMCLAEALLRIPDSATRKALLHDFIEPADWSAHQAHSPSPWVNAVTWGLMLTGRVLAWNTGQHHDVLTGLLGRLGETTILTTVENVARIIATHFVAGEDMREALEHAAGEAAAGNRHSFDMLGEAARTDAQASAYFTRYGDSIAALPGGDGGPDGTAGISVKLSALTPRFDWQGQERALTEVSGRLRELALQARDRQVPLTVDAEEARHLETTLAIFAEVFLDPGLRGWEGFGLAVQAYQPRARTVLGWLGELAARRHRRIAVRLVKGAYWDSEIKYSQLHGHPRYPVFTRKAATDVSYLACCHALFEAPARFFPQFATHNAHTVASVLELARRAGTAQFEFQRLHGMGEALHARAQAQHEAPASRVYAPVGRYRELLPYLVRRLLENGANTSFVHAIADPGWPLERLTADPAGQLADGAGPVVPLPEELYREVRRNAPGLCLECSSTRRAFLHDLHTHAGRRWTALPVVDGEALPGEDEQACVSPADTRRELGSWCAATDTMCRTALDVACAAAGKWSALPADARGTMISTIGDLYWKHRGELITLLVEEAGKTQAGALAELREAIDFCHYYAAESRRLLGKPQALPGPTGESNQLFLRGRGPFACISPWNFPLAIFTGQVVAALATGNPVLAKPASLTPLIAARAHQLMLRAGVWSGVLHLLPCRAEVFSAAVLTDPRIAGVAFTGSTRTARAIQQTLAARDGPIVPLIAETGGQNAMIADSTALTEQVVDAALRSAFDSAGQRCSALRMLYLQEEAADDVIDTLRGALRTLRVGHPGHPATDCGPLISQAAREDVGAHLVGLQRYGRRLGTAGKPADGTPDGYYLAPEMWAIEGIDALQREVFGPVLHVARYARTDLDAVVDAINATGYGLTLGIASRLRSTREHIVARSLAGNIYVNRDMIGATVGVQPFGGNGLSGTGPKAGGPHYLLRFLRETTLTINTTAIGGNAELLGGTRHRSL